MSESIIEKNKLENIDLLQIEYLSDLPFSKRDIVVIEPNKPMAIIIRKFLDSLGFENIFVCKESKEAIKTFSDFVCNEISVPVIIDDNMPNQILKKIINEILEIQPSAKIIVITAKEKTDPQITELFDIGILSITQKPLDSMELKKSLVDIFEKRDSWEKVSMEEKFEILLSSSSIISESRIKSILNVDQSEIEILLKNAKEDQRIILDKEILEVICNQCKSSNITYSSKCPKCKQINFTQEILIEHYKCGEVYQKEAGSNICPKCNNNIGSVGKDYLENTDYYVCKSCGDKFPRPFFELICLECGNVFVEGATQWKKNILYRVRK